MDLLLAYLIVINAAGLLIMLVDKHRAIKNKWRISEAALMTVAAVGGSLGCLAGMKLFRHKTKHPKFTIGVPLLLAVHVVILVLLLPNLI